MPVMNHIGESTATRSNIERFVRKTLGCSCPNEVFELIVINKENPHPGLPVDASLEVGGRLLIYVSFASDIRVLAKGLGRIFQEGMRTRDEKGFSRFRFVVAAHTPQEDVSLLLALFDAMPFIDGKAHLHFASDKDIEAILRPNTV